MATPREPAGEDIAALVIGKPKGGGPMRPPRGGMSDMDDRGPMGPDDESSELPPGFEAAASEAFPDMDPMNYPALKRLIALCMESPEY
jgi:hypothetical protein